MKWKGMLVVYLFLIALFSFFIFWDYGDVLADVDDAGIPGFFNELKDVEKNQNSSSSSSSSSSSGGGSGSGGGSSGGGSSGGSSGGGGSSSGWGSSCGDGECDSGEDPFSCPVDCGTFRCSDGLDNDADGLIDFPNDTACIDGFDDVETEFGLFECYDGVDNDLDGAIDYSNDTGCFDYFDDNESLTKCNDGIDNDLDGWLDFPADIGCEDSNDNNESNDFTSFECSDGLDNDGDGLTDGYDPICLVWNDSSEFAECQDGVDNDLDGLIDYPEDTGCSDLNDNSEGEDCSDGLDNDGDGWFDFPDDPGCDSLGDGNESNDFTSFECSDGLDNDGDGLTDGYDPICLVWNDSSEFAECNDGVDNDGDGWVDLGDPGCNGVNGVSEVNGNTGYQCSNNLDDDGDGLIDGYDLMCSSPTDNDEFSQCNDWVDNDGDGLTDYPEDTGCSDLNDNSEDSENNQRGDQNLIAHYQFENNVLDSSGNGYDGVNNGGLFNSDSKDGGYSLSLDGLSSYVSLPSNIALNGNQATIAFWFKANNVGDYGRFISKADGLGVKDDNHWWMVSLNQGQFRGRLKTLGSTSKVLGGSLSTGIWTHGAMIYDGSEMRLYLDGSKIAMQSKTGTIDVDNTLEVWVGANPGGTDYYDGLMDDLRIYDRVLTDDEIASLAGSCNNDGVCNGFENSCNCFSDCGSVCGDGCITGGEVCEPGNSQSCTTSSGYSGSQTCGSDCSRWGSCSSGDSCGDGICQTYNENSNTCSSDCFCGDGICDSGEDENSCSSDCDNPHPNIFLDSGEISMIKQNIAAGKEPWKSAYSKWKGDADSALNLPPQSVTYQGNTKNDYKTEAPYCGWNDPACKSGNPCGKNCCDGYISNCADRGDYVAVGKLCDSVRDLGLAWQLTRDDKYAQKAISLLNVWMLDSNDYMTPKYSNSQSYIELSINLPACFAGIDFIYDYSGWNPTQKQDILQWVSDFVSTATWVRTNNYENWKNVVLISAGQLLEDSNLVNNAVQSYMDLIPSQMSYKNGDLIMIKEYQRTKGLHYSIYAIHSMSLTAEIARHAGFNLYDYSTSDGRGLNRVAFDHAKYILDENSWPYQNLGGLNKEQHIGAYERFSTQWPSESQFKNVINNKFGGRPWENIYVSGPDTLMHGV